MENNDWDAVMRSIHRRNFRKKVLDTIMTAASLAFLFAFLAFALYGPVWEK